MTIEELKLKYTEKAQNIIAEGTKKLEDLWKEYDRKVEELQEEPKKGRWKPKLDDIYYFIDNTGRIICTPWDGCSIDGCRYAIGNMFKTEEEAQFTVEQLKVLAELKEYVDDNKEWNNSNSHFSIGYETNRERIEAHSYCYTMNAPFNIYFSSEKQAYKAIDAIGEERLKKYYFCVEE